ncbi:DUF881 domain-containing protein [Heliobacterium gestii]|uniref:DUF881 domain-containing protein n=1 Tax=Heliomicrobium gestii TaxID=2699 RepID=A0A845LK15_HELGE|nr:DUF881 domain-containing protein [Heliomicrobium gestii]MBM7867188.1 uncharacterized protein YlxW (UPF0749 family) [Heliomicrobium gestii]MZP43743.1 DUF881 domain-containing protein [Heliomicrobium gestii]
MQWNRRNQAIAVVTLVCFFIGLSTTVQWRTQTEIVRQSSAASVDELTSTLIQTERSKEALAAQLMELKGQLEKYREGENSKQALQQSIEKTRINAGLTRVDGPGVVITLNDSPRAQQFDTIRKDDPNNYFIHDAYLRELVNTLWTGGAEAISINDQRLISTSEIFCGGTTIFVNREYITPPFVISAVGDPKTLTASVNMAMTTLFLKNLRQQYGIVFDVVPSESIQLPAYRGEIKFQYAKAVQDNQAGTQP